MKTKLNTIRLNTIGLNSASVNGVGTDVGKVENEWVPYLVTEGRYLLADGSAYMVKVKMK